MYNITIAASEEPLVLQTESRANARAVALVCQENEIPCEVTAEVVARAVKFQGVGDPKPEAVEPKADPNSGSEASKGNK